MSKKKRPRGRPEKYPHPEPIDASPEEIAQVVLRAEPKEEWRFEQEFNRKRRRGQEAV
jgi:hypothetical protein